MYKVFAITFLLTILLWACNPCKDSNCQNGGNCIDGHCQCLNPYTGKNCEINSCSNIHCNNGGSCVYGACQCSTGYEGIYCDSLATQKFVGNYSCIQNCGGANTSYAAYIYATGLVSAHSVYINYLDNTNPLALAAGLSLTIQSQQLPDGTILSGSGEMTADRHTIVINMSIKPFGGTTSNCTFTLTRI